MVTRKTRKYVSRAYQEMNKALRTKRLRNTEEMPLNQIKQSLGNWLKRFDRDGFADLKIKESSTEPQ